jgi:hypothetical protein
MGYKVWPYAQLEDGSWSIPDDTLRWVWYELVRLDRVKWLFWGGTVTDFNGFVAFLELPQNHPLILMDDELVQPAGIAWLNGVEGNHAIAHFAVIGKYQEGMGDEVLRFWSSFSNGNGKRILDVLIGFIPEINIPAILTVQRIGFDVIGTIPKLCEMPYEGKTVGGTVVYFNWEGV